MSTSAAENADEGARTSFLLVDAKPAMHGELGAPPASLSNISTSSAGPSHATSRGRGFGGRRKASPVLADPRGTYAAVEEALIDAGGRLGLATRSASFCLWDPLEGRNFEAVHRRIAAGANCEAVGGKGTSLAHLALDLPNFKVARLLVEAGASPDQRDQRGRTVLWRAVEGKQSDLASRCIEHGADVTLSPEGEDQSSLAHLALETAQPEVALQILATHSGARLPDMRDSYGRTVLRRALELRQEEVVRMCLTLAADAATVDSMTSRGLVHVALDTGQLQLLPELLRAGALASHADRKGRTPLQMAVEAGDVATADLLLQAGAVPRGGAALALLALLAGRPDLAERLIRAGPVAPEPEGSSGTREAEATGAGSLLLAAMTAGAARVVAAYVACTLEGAGLEASGAAAFAERLSRWLLADGGRADAATYVPVLLELPGALLREGFNGAATQLEALGVPEDVTEPLANGRAGARAESKMGARKARTLPTSHQTRRTGARLSVVTPPEVGKSESLPPSICVHLAEPVGPIADQPDVDGKSAAVGEAAMGRALGQPAPARPAMRSAAPPPCSRLRLPRHPDGHVRLDRGQGLMGRPRGRQRPQRRTRTCSTLTMTSPQRAPASSPDLTDCGATPPPCCPVSRWLMVDGAPFQGGGSDSCG